VRHWIADKLYRVGALLLAALDAMKFNLKAGEVAGIIVIAFCAVITGVAVIGAAGLFGWGPTAATCCGVAVGYMVGVRFR
jgi:hypothetical protein